MKKLILLISISSSIMGCHNSSFNKSNKVSIKSAIPVKSDTVTKHSYVNHPPKIKTYYFQWPNKEEIQPEDFVYFLNETECMIYKLRFPYKYDKLNGIITIYDNRENATPIYFKVMSGFEIKSLLSEMEMDRFEKNLKIYENLNDNSYGLVSMILLNNGAYINGDYNKPGYQIYAFRQIDQDSFFNGLINRVTANEKRNLNLMLSNLQNQNLVLQNKIDIVIDKGEETVNQVLNNKSDYTYKSLTEKWKELNNKQQKIESLDNSLKDSYTNKEFLNSSTLFDIFDSYQEYRDLNNEYPKFNNVFDGEILPLLKQTN